MINIYKITNNVNGKVYIGQTVRTLSDRWSDHCSKSKTLNSKLASAIREFGKDVFTIELIERIDSEEAREAENFWIREYNSIENGYNTFIGTDSREKLNRDEIFKLHGEGLDVYEIAEKIGGYYSTVSKILKSNGLKPNRKGKYFYIGFEEGKEDIKFYSASEAGEFVGVTDSAIRKAIQRNQRSGGYYWKQILRKELE